MSRLLVLAVALIPAHAVGQDAVRKDLVAGVRKALALDKDAHAAKAKELAEKLKAAQKGTINPSADAAVNPPRRPGGPYTYRSLKAKKEFVESVEAEIAARDTVHEDAAGDLRKLVGFMGMPKMDALGHLQSGNGSIVVKKVMARDSAVFEFLYPGVEIVSVRQAKGPDLKVPKQVVKREPFVVTYDTTKMVEGKPFDIDKVFYIGDTATVGDDRIVRAQPVELTAAEKVLVSEK